MLITMVISRFLFFQLRVFFFRYKAKENAILDNVICIFIENILKWRCANFFISTGGWIIRLQKSKFLQNFFLKMAVTWLLSKISTNGLHHWIPWVLLHIFRYLTQNFEIFKPPPFQNPLGTPLPWNYLDWYTVKG